ncbi:hypothetical protein FRC14_005102 [Serendipita sp. 396]|nr:hypothetical protein FRC14_005102 [Serendipita sp. 396]KAG8781120.1 hypothetical protein FRC15_009027 [Serendipita sp. 397]KAG8797593.1 hypothetical protein FRC16_008722 [Serendipita sp. 398]KAG8823475.1 hypothetical protein FRC19_003728 [Serendipita sp. 401]KAG8830275.1 hypothetical protein FRC18_008341 [Serendipita sp. 400]KAG8853969.1 hypothetical protein FRB91_004167 [Serendipita sp. 411]KAG8866343.1 hypothetical protein FRC20_008795 [Serendipita sp. 405]KAG9055168.1 hypothetical prot
MRLTLLASIFATVVTMTLAAAAHSTEPSALVSRNENNESPQGLLDIEPEKNLLSPSRSAISAVATKATSKELHYPALVRRALTEDQARTISHHYSAQSTSAVNVANAHRGVGQPNHDALAADQDRLGMRANHLSRAYGYHADSLRSQQHASHYIPGTPTWHQHTNDADDTALLSQLHFQGADMTHVNLQ